jgi:dimethylaniline monooxygenase (N-oxide forming)
MTGRQVAEYFEAYATHFQLEPHIRFSTTVVKVVRDKEDRGWDVHTTGPNGDEVHFYDKVVFGNGSDTVAKWPSLLGRERFRGAVIHGQQFRECVVNIGSMASWWLTRRQS